MGYKVLLQNVYEVKKQIPAEFFAVYGLVVVGIP
jgi:hypothetical protein